MVEPHVTPMQKEMSIQQLVAEAIQTLKMVGIIPQIAVNIHHRRIKLALKMRLMQPQQGLSMRILQEQKL